MYLPNMQVILTTKRHIISISVFAEPGQTCSSVWWARGTTVFWVMDLLFVILYKSLFPIHFLYTLKAGVAPPPVTRMKFINVQNCYWD